MIPGFLGLRQKGNEAEKEGGTADITTKSELWRKKPSSLFTLGKYPVRKGWLAGFCCFLRSVNHIYPPCLWSGSLSEGPMIPKL